MTPVVASFDPLFLLKGLAVAGAFIAMATDMRTGKIYNWLTFPLMFFGWGANAYFFGLQGLLYSVLGTFVGIGLYMGFAMAGAIGMGDVKLLGAIGSLAGSKFAISTFLYTSVIGIPHALLILYLNHGKNTFKDLSVSLTTGSFLEKTIHTDNATQKYHYYLGLDILLGTILAWVIEIPIKF